MNCSKELDYHRFPIHHGGLIINLTLLRKSVHYQTNFQEIWYLSHLLQIKVTKISYLGHLLHFGGHFGKRYALENSQTGTFIA